MSIVMRLRQGGRKNKRTFRCVIADVRSPRDGKYIDCVGHYNPHALDGNVVLHKEKVQHWLEKGVKPTEKMLSLIEKACPEVLARK